METTRFKVNKDASKSIETLDQGKQFMRISDALLYAHSHTKKGNQPYIYDSLVEVWILPKQPQHSGTLTQRATYSVMVARELERDYTGFTREIALKEKDSTSFTLEL